MISLIDIATEIVKKAMRCQLNFINESHMKKFFKFVGLLFSVTILTTFLINTLSYVFKIGSTSVIASPLIRSKNPAPTHDEVGEVKFIPKK